MPEESQSPLAEGAQGPGSGSGGDAAVPAVAAESPALAASAVVAAPAAAAAAAATGDIGNAIGAAGSGQAVDQVADPSAAQTDPQEALQTAAHAATQAVGNPASQTAPGAPQQDPAGDQIPVALAPPDPRMTLDAMRTSLPQEMGPILEVAYTRITDDVRVLLTTAIEATKRHKTLGHVFSEPVDYIGLELEDYLDVVKRPMDLSSLAVNLALGEYYYLYEFLRDADLIWANCRTYNGHSSNDFFYNAANDVEAFFVQQVENSLHIGLTHRFYKVIVRSTSIPNRAFEAQPIPLANVQLLLRRLSELPDDDIAECVIWYVNRSGADPDAVFGDEIVLQFTNADTQLLREWESVIQSRVQAYREAKKERAKKQKK